MGKVQSVAFARFLTYSPTRGTALLKGFQLTGREDRQKVCRRCGGEGVTGWLWALELDLEGRLVFLMEGIQKGREKTPQSRQHSQVRGPAWQKCGGDRPRAAPHTGSGRSPPNQSWMQRSHAQNAAAACPAAPRPGWGEGKQRPEETIAAPQGEAVMAIPAVNQARGSLERCTFFLENRKTTCWNCCWSISSAPLTPTWRSNLTGESCGGRERRRRRK